MITPGNIWCVIQASPEVATQAWWQALTDPLAWGRSPEASHSPYGNEPISLPGRIQIETFDEGGSGISYVDRDPESWSPSKDRNITAFRVLEEVDFDDAHDDEAGYAITQTAAGECLDYTVKVLQSGSYQISARVAAARGDGAFHIQVNGEDATGRVSVPVTGGSQAWRTIDVGTVKLASGLHKMRLGLMRATSASIG